MLPLRLFHELSLTHTHTQTNTATLIHICIPAILIHDIRKRAKNKEQQKETTTTAKIEEKLIKYRKIFFFKLPFQFITKIGRYLYLLG